MKTVTSTKRKQHLFKHTHVFIWTKKAIHTKDPRYFDIGFIHPNIQTQRSIQWARITVMKYHHGHKTKKDGKKYYLEPLFLYQEGIEDWKIEEDTWKFCEGVTVSKRSSTRLRCSPRCWKGSPPWP